MAMNGQTTSRSRILRQVFVGLAVIALCLGALSWVSSAAGLGLFGFLQPTLEDVLDGRRADAERLAAIQTVDKWMAQSIAPGAALAGTQTFTMCAWGQNNPEVNDGYRLRCTASGVLVSSWVGSFDGFTRAMASRLEATCPGAGPWRTPLSPGSRGHSGPLRYECSNGLTLYVIFGGSGRAASDGLANGVLPCTGDFRCISGATDVELRQAVTGSDFYAIQQIDNTFYEDQLW